MRQRRFRFSFQSTAWASLIALFSVQSAAARDDLSVQLPLPKPGDHVLHILSPSLLELVLVNSKQPDPAHVDSWDWVNGQENFVPPSTSSLKVIVNGQTNNVSGIG